MELEKIALSDPYFVERKLYPNVDFYSGIILKAMGFPTSIFTALFAVARTVGWISQWEEMSRDPEQRIGRPRQLYIGAPRRDFVRNRGSAPETSRNREATFRRVKSGSRSGERLPFLILFWIQIWWDTH